MFLFIFTNDYRFSILRTFPIRAAKLTGLWDCALVNYHGIRHLQRNKTAEVNSSFTFALDNILHFFKENWENKSCLVENLVFPTVSIISKFRKFLPLNDNT